jgi:hypothetical protein
MDLNEHEFYMRRVEAEALRERKVYKRSILPMARFLIYLFMVLSFMGRLHAQSFTLVLQNKERDYNWGLSFYCNDSVYQLFVTNWVGFIVSKLLISDGVVIRSQSRIEFEDDKKTIIGAFVKKQESWYLDSIHFNCKGIILSKYERSFKDFTPDPLTVRDLQSRTTIGGFKNRKSSITMHISFSEKT